jgi:tripartite-type tricarboxylate transporter receptor subunit TctC
VNESLFAKLPGTAGPMLHLTRPIFVGWVSRLRRNPPLAVYPSRGWWVALRSTHPTVLWFALCVSAAIAQAQSYPNRPLRIVVGFTAGGAVDFVARVVGQKLTEQYGQPVVVENRPGASTVIAAERVVSAAPDGYTLLLIPISTAVQSGLRKNLIAWYGVSVPAAVPKAIVAQLNGALGRIVQMPDVRDALQKQAMEPQAGTPEQFAALIAREIEQTIKLQQIAGIKAE